MDRIEVGKHYRLISNELTGDWGGAEVVVFEAFEEGTRTFHWVKENTYNFEIVDKDKYPPYDSEIEDPQEEYKWKGLAFENELLPLEK